MQQPTHQRPDPDHGGVYRWRADVAAALDKLHEWRNCAHRADFASAAEHDRDCPAEGQS